MATDTHIYKYINTAVKHAVDKAEARFEGKLVVFKDEIKREFNHTSGAYQEWMQDQLAKIIEVVKDHPGREEIREIVREEVRLETRPIRAEMRLYRESLIDHEKRITTLEHIPA